MRYLSLLLATAWLEAACQPVHGEAIRGEDLAAVAAAFEPAAGQTVAIAPLAGAERRFTRADLVRLARKFGLAEPPGEALPDSICFAYALHRLTDDEILPAIRAAGADAAVEIASHSVFPVPAGRLVFEPFRSRPDRRDGSQLLRGSVIYGPGRKQPIWARVRLLEPRAGLVAIRSLRPGEPLAPTDFTMGELSAWTGLRVASFAEIEGRVLRRALAAGTPIVPGMLTRPRDIGPGETARVTVRAGAARLSFEARAETGGFAGEAVLLRSPVSGQRFKAKIESRLHAVLNMEGR